MGLFKSIGHVLFGKTTKPKVKRYDIYTPGQKEILNKFVEFVKPHVGEPAPVYPGERVAPVSGLLQQAFNRVENMQSPTQSQPYQQGLGLLNSLSQPYNPEQAQEYWKQAVYEPALRQYEQDLLPKLQERFIANNAVDSSAFNRAIAKSSEELMKDLGSKLAETVFRDRANNLAIQASLPSQFLQYTSTPLELEKQQVGLLGSLGQTQRAIEQEKLNEAYKKWLEAQPYSSPYLSLGLQALGIQPFGVYMRPGRHTKGLLQSGMELAAKVAPYALMAMNPAAGAAAAGSGLLNSLSGSGGMSPFSTLRLPYQQFPTYTI